MRGQEDEGFPWDEYTDECIEAWIAWHECLAAAPCGPWDGCEFAYQLKTYHCWRFNTVDCGAACGDPTSSGWEDCDHLMGASFGAYLPRLCSEQTPDYCRCGNYGCLHGEYCCSYWPCEEETM